MVPKGSKRGPKGVQGRPKDDENGAEMDSLRKPCKEQATARKTAAKSFENTRKLEGNPKETWGKPNENLTNTRFNRSKIQWKNRKIPRKPNEKIKETPG